MSKKRSFGASIAFPKGVFFLCMEGMKAMKPEGQVRIPSGCAISAVISRKGERISGEKIITSMKPMRERSNGLGGGFAAYGIYPEMKEHYALHVFFNDDSCRAECEKFLKESFEVVSAKVIPTRKTPEITDEPLIWRYFVSPLKSVLVSMQRTRRSTSSASSQDQQTMKGCYVFSCGRTWALSKPSFSGGRSGILPA